MHESFSRSRLFDMGEGKGEKRREGRAVSLVGFWRTVRWRLGWASRSLSFGQVGHPVADTERCQAGFPLLDTLVALLFYIYLWESAKEKQEDFGSWFNVCVKSYSMTYFLGLFKAGLISLSSLSRREVKLTLLLSWVTGLHHPPIWLAASGKQTTHLLANSYCSICNDPTF